MREWQLTAGDPLAMRFAADVRLGRTDYADDQSWEIAFGSPQEPAISVQTRYGGRAGLARIVPMWEFDGRAVYETQAFAERPVLRIFTPNYARITARILATLGLTYELWVIDSHTVGARMTLRNDADSPAQFMLDVFAQIVRDGRSADMKVIGLPGNVEALQLGTIANLNPVLLLEGASGSRESQNASPRLSAPLTIPPRGAVAIRWVHAALSTLDASIQAARKALFNTDWDAAFSVIETLNAHTPTVETGNPDWDAILAFGAQVMLRDFVGATGKLPYPSFVSARIPARGFSPRADGSDQGPEWSGQTAHESYLIAPTAAMIAPDLAHGLIRNALAVRQTDGWIDSKPGLGGQRSRLLAEPLLAATAWAIYQQTEDKHFLSEVFAGLSQFYDRWFQRDMDRDGDGIPEWTNAEQSIYAESQTFNRYRRWSVNADISKAETPDLIAYLIREGQSLLLMDAELGHKSPIAATIQAHIDSLQAQLTTLWDADRGLYAARDRDTHQLPHGEQLFRGHGDESYSDKAAITPPNRLIIRTTGGKEHAPRVSVVIEGVNAQGAAVSETIPASAFVWFYGLGTAVTEQVYARVNYVKFDGLSRVYGVEIDTVDLTRDALPNYAPLWAGVDADHARRLVHHLSDPAEYALPGGLPLSVTATMAADDSNGQVTLFWNALIIEALIENGFADVAAGLVGRLLDVQSHALKQDGAFRSAYDAHTGAGNGDPDTLNGVLPLHLFMKLIGVRIINSQRVWAGGAFPLSVPVIITQHGITVTRSADGTHVQFPSGYAAQVGTEWQLIEDHTVPAPSAEAPVPETPTTTQSPVSSFDTVIPVEAQRDPTVEVPINHLDFTPTASTTPRDVPRDPPADVPPAKPAPTIKIPVRRPKKDNSDG